MIQCRRKVECTKGLKKEVNGIESITCPRTIRIVGSTNFILSWTLFLPACLVPTQLYACR